MKVNGFMVDVLEYTLGTNSFIKVQLCNDANVESPHWEDFDLEKVGKTPHTFENTSKEGTALGIKVLITKGETKSTFKRLEGGWN